MKRVVCSEWKNLHPLLASTQHFTLLCLLEICYITLWHKTDTISEFLAVAHNETREWHMEKSFRTCLSCKIYKKHARTCSNIFISSVSISVYLKHELNYKKHNTTGMRRRLPAVSAVVSFVYSNYTTVFLLFSQWFINVQNFTWHFEGIYQSPL